MCIQRALHCPKGVYSVSEAGDFSEKSDTKEVVVELIRATADVNGDVALM